MNSTCTANKLNENIPKKKAAAKNAAAAERLVSTKLRIKSQTMYFYYSQMVFDFAHLSTPLRENIIYKSVRIQNKYFLLHHQVRRNMCHLVSLNFPIYHPNHFDIVVGIVLGYPND